MTDVRPFRGLRYDPTRVDLSNVIVPPYDVIAADERGSFFDRDPHNAIRFELTREVADEAAADYSDIASTLEAWRESGVLVQDGGPAFYAMRQRYEGPSGEMLERTGFFAELGLAEYDERQVLPHERTLAGPKADRLKLLRAAKANLSSVFMLYQDQGQELAADLDAAFSDNLLGEARDDGGVEYAIALVRGEAAERISSFLKTRSVVIADGHHRYETALNYRREQREAGAGEGADSESTLAYFANAYAPGSLLLPIHRVIKSQPAPTDAEWAERLPGWEQTQVSISGSEDIAAALDTELGKRAGQRAFAADDGSGTLRIFSRAEDLGEELMVRVLEGEVIGKVFGLDTEAIRNGSVTFWKKADRAASDVRSGGGTVALYLNALTPDDVLRVTGAGEVMPQKSTFFYPKIPTGIVFRVHDSEAQ